MGICIFAYDGGVKSFFTTSFMTIVSYDFLFFIMFSWFRKTYLNIILIKSLLIFQIARLQD